MDLSNYPILELEFFGNTILQYTFALLLFLGSLLMLKIIKSVILLKIKKIAKKTDTEIDDIIIDGIRAIHWPFFVLIAINIGILAVNISSIITKGLSYAMIIAAVYYAIKVVEKFVDFGTHTMLSKKNGDDNGGREIIKISGSILKFVIWIGAIVLILGNLGYNVTSLVAGLGIGGIAIALAIQSILQDMFSSFSIYFDKPFRVGDFVVLGSHSGTVKKIGIKTTRIQTPQGEELVVSNQELTKSKIQNFGQMERRRTLFSLGVTYSTSSDVLKRIPEIIKNIVDKAEHATFDRTHLKSFNNSSLDFEVVYYIEAPDYMIYMDTRHNINLRIIEEFTKEKIEFAYPTQTIIIDK